MSKTTNLITMEDVISLEQRLKKEGFEKAYKMIAELTRIAILDPSSVVRQDAISKLTKHYNGLIRKGYEFNGKLFLRVNNKEGNPNTYFICQVPKYYLGEQPKPEPFDLNIN